MDTDRGFLKTIYVVQPVSHDYICGLCDEVLNDPLQCKNGHMNCDECWRDLTKKTGPECTICRTNVFGSLSRSLVIGQQVAALLVTCECLEDQQVILQNDGMGCGWTGTVIDRSARFCPLLYGVCPNIGCSIQLPLKRLINHRWNCPKRLKICPECTLEFTFAELCGIHKTTCPNRVHYVTCSCNVVVKENELHMHKDYACPLTMLACPYMRDLNKCVDGCDGFVQRSQLSSHLGANGALIKDLHSTIMDLRQAGGL